MEQGHNFDLLDAPQGQYLVEGRGAGTAGFVIGLVALVLWIFVALVAYAQALFGGGFITAGIWTGISLLGLVLSIYGFSRLRHTGGKTGLAIAGIACSAVAFLLCLWTFHNVQVIHATTGDLSRTLKDMQEQMQHSMDSLNHPGRRH
jgi:hypothetical protein